MAVSQCLNFTGHGSLDRKQRTRRLARRKPRIRCNLRFRHLSDIGDLPNVRFAPNSSYLHAKSLQKSGHSWNQVTPGIMQGRPPGRSTILMLHRGGNTETEARARRKSAFAGIFVSVRQLAESNGYPELPGFPGISFWDSCRVQYRQVADPPGLIGGRPRTGP
jgi:hypothetical protein